MLGLMQEFPLLVHRVLDHAARWHGETEIISRSVEGPIQRTTYTELDRRSRALASAVNKRLGVGMSSIVGTMAWNGWRHLEIWYGVMGLGGIVHTLNPRLFADQLAYIRHKERKFGRGCLDAWRANQKALLAELTALLLPFEQMLGTRRFLLDDQPRFVDFDLWGMLANFLYSGRYSLPAIHPKTAVWYRRMSRIKLANAKK